MGDREDIMDLDLNLGPIGPVPPVLGARTEQSSSEFVHIDEWGSLREALRNRTRQRWRWRHLQIPFPAHSLQLTVDSDGNGSNSGIDGEEEGGGGGGNGILQAGEGSVAPEERTTHEPTKSCENHVTLAENGSVDEREEVMKTSNEEGSFFDCNICLDLAKEPVVTCCGHLFCWPCIYRWLQIHSDARECPVCKGEVTLKTVTPIYGRGNHTREPEEDPSIKIPVRPSARRVESLRQTIQRTASSFPMEEMIRRLGARFELTRDFFQLPDADSSRDRASMLDRYLTSRALRREQAQNQSPAINPEDVVDLTQERVEVPTQQRRLPPLTYRRGQSHRGAQTFNDRLLEAYLRRSPPTRSQEPSPSVDDRDSFSSIAAVIHGESQTVDTAVEIDSLVSLSTSSSSRRRNDPASLVSLSTSSSSRRRNDASSRPSDVDSGDSRAPRRRRLN